MTADRRKSKHPHGESEDFLTHPSQLEHARASLEQKESVGDRVRKARQTHNLTIQELSKRTGIDSDTLRRVEANEVIPPLGELVKLGKALETGMGFFISPGVEKSVSVTRSHQRKPFSRRAGKADTRYGYSYESLAPDKANRSMEPFLVTLTPSEEVEPSTHDGQEFLFVLEGEMMAKVGEQTEHLGAGDAIYYDSSTPHFVKCVGGKPARILAVLYASR